MTKDKIKCGDRVFVTKSEGINPSRAIDLFRRQSSLVTNIKKGIASLYIIGQYGENHYAQAPIENLVKVYGKGEITIGMIVKIKKGILAPTFVADKPFRVVSVSKERGGELRAQIENDYNTHIDIPVDNLEPYYTAENIRNMEKELSEQAKEYLKAHSDEEKYARYRDGKWNFIPKIDFLGTMERKEAERICKSVLTQEDFCKELNPEEHRIETPFQDLLANEKWESYRRAVAGQIAVKLANVENCSPAEVGRYAVETATMVVKQLREITI